jgi:next-to-BRCA1 protein 1
MQEKTLPEDHPASCDLCHKRIRGIRTKCTDCPDWDCCEACLPNLGNRHPGHTLVKINLASDLVEPPFRHQKVKHTNIICDMCQGPVVGDRWKCVHPDCDDYDLCDNCHASPLNTHPREHPILKLSAPVHIDFVSRIRKETQPGSFRPGKPCDFGRREGEYATLTKQDREDLMTRWRCRDHSTFEDCERARIRCHVSKGVLQGPNSKKSSEAGSPPKRVKLNLPDVDDIKQEEFPTQPESGPSNTAIEVDQPLEFKPSTDIDEFAPGSHPDIIKCYIYPETLAICPAKPEDDRCITPTIDPSLDTETPTINPSIDTETPTDSLVSDITTPSNDSIFTGIKDVTIPAGCSLPVGAEFTKTWSMKHLVSGHEYKFDQLRLVHESGGLLGEACNIQLAFTQDEIKTGEKVEVSIVGLKVPDLPEQQVIEQWRFRDVDGTAYGEPLRLRYVSHLMYWLN